MLCQLFEFNHLFSYSSSI